MIDSLTSMAVALLDECPKGSKIVITPHLRADGDAIGSGLGLRAALLSLGYDVRLLLDEEVTERLLFVPEVECAEVFDPGKSASEEIDILFLVDCHEASRLGERAVLWDQAKDHFVLDHHRYEQAVQGNAWIDPSCSSMGEMIYYFIRELEKHSGEKILNRNIAIQLAVAIYSDTGGLRFSNSTRDTFLAMAALQEAGVVLDRISEPLFSTSSLGRFRGRGFAFQAAEWEVDGRLAWTMMREADCLACGADDDDLGGIANDLREVQGTDVAIFFRLTEENILRLNIRSSEDFNSASFAQSLGGGGHFRAAGAEIQLSENESVDERIRAILDQAAEILKATPHVLD